MEWMVPAVDFVSVPYSSQVYFELHYDAACLDCTNNESCFTVEMKFNGLPFVFDNCKDTNALLNNTSQVCSYTDFMSHIESIKTKGDLDEVCQQPFVPPHKFDQYLDSQNIMSL